MIIMMAICNLIRKKNIPPSGKVPFSVCISKDPDELFEQYDFKRQNYASDYDFSHLSLEVDKQSDLVET
jgi:hypothetical protein